MRSEYNRICNNYLYEKSRYGFDPSDSQVLDHTIEFSEDDLKMMWEKIEESETVQPFHNYAFYLGIIWKKNKMNRVECCQLAIDRTNKRIIIHELGKNVRISYELFYFFDEIVEY
jgi:hypothetical protein